MKYLVFVILLLSTIRTSAQEHLYPDDSSYSHLPILIEYDLFVTRALRAAHNRNVILKVFIIPSFHPESVLYIEKSNESYSLIHLEAEQQYWLEYDKGITPAPIEKCNLKINDAFAKKVENVWQSELRKTKYPEKLRMGMDGVTYHFSTPSNSIHQGKSLPRMAGTMWSPSENSRMAALENLVWALTDYCKNETTLADATKALDKLL